MNLGLHPEKSWRILIVRLSAIGDCLHAVPVMEAIRTQLPSAKIGWLIQKGGLNLLQNHPGVDQFHVFDRGRKGVDALRALASLRRELRAEQYDIALDLQGLTKSGFLARMSGASVAMGFAAPESRELNRVFVNRRQAVPASVEHVVDRNLALLPALGLEVPPRATWTLPPVDLAGTQAASLLDELPEAEKLALINPGTTWPTKVWPQERFAEVAAALSERMQVVVTWGGAEESAMADRIVGMAGEMVGTERARRVQKAPATSLAELSGLFQRSSIVVANDSGPLHLAVALGIPAVGIYGPTDPARNGPYGWRDASWPSAVVTLADVDHRVLGSETIGGGQVLECQYCWKASCKRGDTACMAELGSKVVIERALALMDARGTI